MRKFKNFMVRLILKIYKNRLELQMKANFDPELSHKLEALDILLRD